MSKAAASDRIRLSFMLEKEKVQKKSVSFLREALPSQKKGRSPYSSITFLL